MASLAKIAPWHHLVVAGSAAAVGIAAFTGVIGEDRPEHFDAKQVVIAPQGENGLRITETVDQDFGEQQRHGYERIIPDDFGEPTDVMAAATDAPDDLDVHSMGWETRIRIGDADTTVTGQHRYTLAYTLPAAHLSGGDLALDVIGNEETLETDRFEVIVTGLELEDTTCNVGGFGDVGGCELVDDGETYRVVFEPLEPGEGVTIGGDIVGRRDIVAIEPPPLPDAPADRRVPLGIATTVLGLATGAGTFAWARRRGRNEVAPGGAADVAFGFSGVPLPPPPAGTAVPADVSAGLGAPDLPPPSPSSSPVVTAPLGTGVRLVTDAELAELATTEFAPPAGVDPWLGRVLLKEGFDNETVASWISGHAARDVLTVSETDAGKVELRVGPRWDSAPGEERSALQRMMGGDQIVLGKYSKTFAAGWADIAKRQREFVAASGFWKRPIGSSVGAAGTALVGIAVLVALGLMFVAGSALRSAPVLGSPVVALLLAIIGPGLAGLAVYSRLLPARTVSGSALALRTESFRRFLAASEARHVEWAWEHGMLREYSAWAVALGTADAWESAIRGSTVPPAELNVAPILLYHYASSLGSTRVPPSSSGGGGAGGGGGFSGGSVGGGGGGGSSGSW